VSIWLRVRDQILTIACSRPPDYLVGGTLSPYLRRWWVIPRNRWFNIYLHQFLRSDDDRALHDHPWVSCSIVLLGSYREHIAGSVRDVFPGDILLRAPRTAHRIEVAPGGGCWTLFITGPRVREWGFHCPQGWRPWHQFVNADRPGEIGPGCGD